jgi:K+-sensing histidine kinase KdpD
MHHEDLPHEILREARAAGCRRIVVGRNSFPAIDELFSEHLGEQLQKNANEISVSIVE